MITECKIMTDTAPLCLALEGLLKLVPSIPQEFSDRIPRTFNTSSEFIAIENKPTPVGILAISLEPSDFFLNLLVAVRDR